MKRTIAAGTLLVAALILVYGYTATRREHQFRQLVLRGDFALARGDTFGALSAFGDAIALKPDSMVGYLKRGDAYRRRGELDPALNDLRRASALDPASTRALELLGDVEMGRQAYDRAADCYAAYVRLDDRSPRVLYKLGLARHAAGRYEPAVDALRTAVGLDSKFAEAHYLLGVCLVEMNRLPQARRSLERAVALAPGLQQAREQLAEVYGALNRSRERAQQLAALYARDPRPARQVALALSRAARGQTAEAVRVLGQSADLHPDHADTYVALGRIWLDAARAGRDEVALSKAIAALQGAASIDPSSTALALLGEALLLRPNAALAERTLRQAVEKLPVSPATFLHLADAAEGAGQLRTARTALLDYSSLSPERDDRQVDVAGRIGDLSMQLGEPKTAATWYERAARSPRASIALLLRLARAQADAGDVGAARATLVRIRERDPDNQAARALHDRLQ